MERPFVRVGDWEMGCYIYDNFFEIQVVQKENGDEDHGYRGDSASGPV